MKLTTTRDVAVTIIGAGPSGVTAALELIETGRFEAGDIHIVDPEFKCGQLRQFANVPGNTTAGDHLGALARYKSGRARPKLKIDKLADDVTPTLSSLAGPLEWLTANVVLPRVTTHCGKVFELERIGDLWSVQIQGARGQLETLRSRTVIITSGARPKMLDGLSISDGTRGKLVALTDALDPARALSVVSPHDSVAIIGSSHSGILALMNLLQTGVKGPNTITVFYRSGIKFSETDSYGRKIYDNLGLKGLPHKWAKAHLVSDTNSIRLRNPRDFETKVTFIRLDGDEVLSAALESGELFTKIVDARGLVPHKTPYVSTPQQGRKSIAAIARFGAVVGYPGLYCCGTLAPRVVEESSAGHAPIRVGNVGVTKFVADNIALAEDLIAYLQAGIASIDSSDKATATYIA